MKLNNKGFAISTIMYIILVMAIILMVLTLTNLSNRKLILDKQKEVVIDRLSTDDDMSIYTPKIEVDTYDWATSKTVTITFPELDRDDVTNEYKTTEDADWIVAQENPVILTVTQNTIVEARTRYALNVNSTELKVNKVDNDPPVVTRVSGNTGNTWVQSRKLVVEANDGSGIGIQSYSFDNGLSWQESNEYTATESRIYYIKVKDKLNNTMETAYEVDVSKIDNNSPTINDVTGNDDEWSTSKKLTVDATDDEGTDLEYSFDGGQTWQKDPTFEVDKNGTYDVKVRDEAGNESDVFQVTVDKIDNVTPTIKITEDSKGSNFISITIETTEGGMGLEKIEYLITPGMTDYESNEVDNTHKFSSLTKNTKYTIKARVTSKNGKTAESNVLTVTTLNLIAPEISVSPDGWATSKEVTITYPTIEGQDLTYQYQKDSGSWEDTTLATTKVPFDSNGTIKAKVTDGTNTVSTDIVSVTQIDNDPPVVTSVSGNSGDTWVQSRKLVVEANDGEGIGIQSYSFDNGETWQDSNEYTATESRIYYIKVKDKLNNTMEKAYEVNVSKVDSDDPIITDVTGNDDEWSKSKTLTVETDDGDGSGVKEWSFDGGKTWQKDPTFEVDENGTYDVKVRDEAGNESDVFQVTVDKISTTAPKISIEESAVGSSFITVKAIVTDNEMGPEKIVYTITADNYSEQYEDLKSGSNYTFQGLTKKTEYTIKATVISKNGKSAESNVLTITTLDLEPPIIDVAPEGWSKEKTVTITYPELDVQDLTYEFSIDDGEFEVTTDNPKIFTVTKNCTITARVTDGTNVLSASSATITTIDNNSPTINDVTGNDDEWSTSKKLTVDATDGESTDLEYSFDGGDTWQKDPTFEVDKNGTYDVKVRDEAGNESDVFQVTVDKIDNVTPTIKITEDSKGSNFISITIETTEGGMGLEKIEYLITPGMADYESNGVEKNHIFQGLDKNTKYTIKARVVSKNGKTAESNVLVITTEDIPDPIISISPEGWATSKEVTITYPTIKGQKLTYQYQKDDGEWETVTTTSTNVTFNANGTITAKVSDGNNTVSLKPVSVTQIDTEPPMINSVIGNDDEWSTNKTLVVNATDNNGSGIATKGGYSFDDGLSWQDSNELTVTENKTYKIKVKDAVGNVTETATDVTVSKISTTAPKITIEKSAVGSSFITVKATVTDNEMGAEKIEYKIGTGAYTADGVNTTHTFTKLTKATEYKIQAKVTSKNGKTAESNILTITTLDLTPPEISVSPDGWATSKTVIITYPTIKGQDLTYQYQKDGGEWETSQSATETLTFNANGTITAKVTDDDNIVTSKSVSVTQIDNNPPSVIEVTGNDDEWSTSKTLVVNATDNDESGIATTKGYSFDDGETWQNSNKLTVTENKTYKIKVKDVLENTMTTSYDVEVTKIDREPPVINDVTGNDDEWSTSKTLVVDATDSKSGIATTKGYSFDDG